MLDPDYSNDDISVPHNVWFCHLCPNWATFQTSKEIQYRYLCWTWVHINKWFKFIMKYYNDIARGKSVNLETVNAGWRGVGTKEFQSPIRVIGEKVTLSPKSHHFKYILQKYMENPNSGEKTLDGSAVATLPILY